MSSLAIFLVSLSGGGAERVMLYLARGFVEQGLNVDLVLVKKEGPYLSSIPPGVRVVDLGASRLLLSIPALIRYLQQNKPTALLSAMEDINVAALWARRIAGVSTRVVVTVHNTLSQESQNSIAIKKRLAPYLARLFYPWADAVVTVSKGSAEDLAQLGISSERLKVIYNPVVTPELAKKAVEPVEHPWFAPGATPVILAVGRLEKQKDFPTLIRAFALVKQQRPVRLMILGEGTERASLEALVRELGLGADVALPGFVDNPYAYMAKAAVFVLSSLYEGLPTVLIEAMAGGTPVVSTDCKSGPAEILENGRYGKLVPVGDIKSLADAIATTLDESPDKAALQGKAAEFSLEKAVTQYLQVLQVG
ncbi:glycosyltransferase [Argonema antarcticum]|uniref:glycosyltransferase n=1 Tax=Argonema antarcticum TaxID=2942763 RepID=UPI002010DA9E|nr:glycosyltransferase [Argonema antarcticum A004/B2]